MASNVPGTKKFNFVSPGIFLNEIDKSQIAKPPLGIGPMVIGRARRGPGNRPVRVSSYAEFVQIFGNPHPGVATGDIWRSADGPPGPTYAAYAAQAWLANNTPLTFMRLVGTEHSTPDTTQLGKAGWRTWNGSSKTTATGVQRAAASAGGAYGLWLCHSSSTDAPGGGGRDGSPASGTLAAIWYVSNGSMRLSGTVRGSTTVTTGAAAHLVQSTGTGAEFVAEIYNSAGTSIVDKVTFNFAEGSSKHVRKAFNTNPTMINGAITSNTKNYWLGETFEKAVKDKVLANQTAAGAVFGMILGLENDAGTEEWSNHQYAAQPAKSPWVFSQHMGQPADFKPSACQKLFRLVTHQAGQWDMHNLKIAIEDIKPSTSDLNPFGTFTLTLRQLSDHDADQQVIERYSGLNLNPASTNYIGARIGTQYTTFDSTQRRLRTYGKYRNRSQYVYVEMNEELDENGLDPALLPFGWEAPPQPYGFSLLGRDAGNTIDGGFFKLGTSDGPASSTQATAVISFTGKPHETKILTLVDAAGVSITFEVDGDGDGVTGSRVALTPADSTAAAMATELAAEIEGESFGISAVVTDSTKVTLTMDTAGTVGNKTITSDFTNSTVPASFSDGRDAGTLTTLAFVAGNNEIPWSATGTNVPVESAANFTGSFTWPTLSCRATSSDGGFVMPTKGYFGFYTGKSASDTNFEPSTLDLLRPLPSALNTYVATSATQSPFWFTLDDLSGSVNSDSPDPDLNDHVIWVSGSRISGNSISSVSTGSADGSNPNQNPDGWKYLLHKLKINKFVMPMFGGSDGLDITEREPFRNNLLSDANGDPKKSWSYNTIDEALDIITNSEDYEYNIATMPGITETGLTKKLVDVCQERGDALAIIDIENVYVPSTENTDSETNRRKSVRAAATAMQDRQLNSSYGCCYYPWVQIQDTIAGINLFAPPSIVALGTMASSEAVSEPWFAPAGFNRGGLSDGAAGIPVIGVTEKLTAKQRDQLYESNINPIASFPAEGIVIFGQKTLQITPSALDRINVRRLMIFIKKAVSRYSAKVLFDQNVQVTWNRFLSMVEPFLKSVQGRLGLSDFRVVLDSTTTTDELVDRNIMYAKIYLKPARAIEFIVVDFVITSTGASFDD